MSIHRPPPRLSLVPATVEPGFSARVGQSLLDPRRAAQRLCQGGRGGLRDALLLLCARVCAQQLQPLCRGVLRAQEEGSGALSAALTQALLAAREDLVLILGGGVLLSLLMGPGERYLRPGLGVELSAQAWLGWLAVQLAGTLLLALSRLTPAPTGLAARGATAIQVLGLCSFVALWLIALQQARRAARRAFARAHTAPTGPTALGQDRN